MRLNGFYSLIIIALLFTVASCTTRQKTVNYDMSYIYHSEKTKIQYKVLVENDSLIFFISFYNPIEFDNKTVQDFLSEYEFSYKFTPDQYSSQVILSDSIGLEESEVFAQQSTFKYSFKIPKANISSGLLMIYKNELKNKRVEVIDIPIDFSGFQMDKNYLFINSNTGFPELGNFLIKNDTVIIKSNIVTDDSSFVYHYNHKFLPAAPPMALTRADEKKTLDIDTTFSIEINKGIAFASAGLYFVQKDTSGNEGFSITVVENKYPAITRVEEMIEPLCYLTTKEEQKQLESSNNYKSTIDSFWLKIGGNKDYSKQLIKAYYQKVEYANRFFTSFKEGWKTDRGIIYTIFGKPDQVHKFIDKEEWIYENMFSEVILFTFVKKQNIFSDNHYELIRNPEYEKYWNLTIEKWRNGIITK